MENEIQVIFFDINGTYEQNEDEDPNNSTKLESPQRIFEKFINYQKIKSIVKIDDEQNKIKYTWKEELIEKQPYSGTFYIISDLSYCHTVSLESDGFIIFCNLEEEDTLEKLEKIIEYIKDNCNLDIINYIIGIYKNNKLQSLSKNKIEDYLHQHENFLFKYYESNDGEVGEEDTNDTLKEVFGDIYKI